MNNIQKAMELGQSIWLDYIRRSFITSGELEALIGQGLMGMTSNPSIFEKAITGSSDYDADLARLAGEGLTTGEIYDAITLQDIGMATDTFRPVYDATDQADGFVSLEVNPLLAADTESTISEGVRLFNALGRPNVMIKVPATPEGFPAIRTLIGMGINVNVTLIFSVGQYRKAAEAYLAGLEDLVSTGAKPVTVSSVASLFVSRLDTVVDGMLERMGLENPQGWTAIANAKMVYAEFLDIFSGPRWKKLAEAGGRAQRPLWASTSTKNPRYPDTMYVDELLGPRTVNTLPIATLHAFLDHGEPALTLATDFKEAREHLKHIRELGINLDTIMDTLLAKGIESFSASFRSIMAGISSKAAQLAGGDKALCMELGQYTKAVDQTLESIRDDRVLARIWSHDHTVWKPEPSGIAERLGWLNCPENMTGAIPRIEQLADQAGAAGYTHALLLGMGGSSLAPFVFRRTFGVATGHLDLAVLDSTDPSAVLEYTQRMDPAKTLFIVSTKSGTTTETLSFFRYFYNITAMAVGPAAGDHFIAITDPGSALERLAWEHDFRHIFLNDPNIGGRYSVLSYFGLVPAALIGMDVHTLLDQASRVAENCVSSNCPVAGDNAGGRLGAAMGHLATAGVDKLTIVASPAVMAFGAWLEQLLAESTGKEGKGILPVDAERMGEVDVYGDDRLFVYLRLDGDDTHDAAIDRLSGAGHPVIRINIKDLYDLGGEFFRWEMATAVAGHIMGINPFDQPNVESAKIQARVMLEEFKKEGKLPELTPTLEENGMVVYSSRKWTTLSEALNGFLALAQPGDYAAIQAYIAPTEGFAVLLDEFRTTIRDRWKIATTVGFGPRFLHSTGQLHKGDRGNGLFIQITSDDTTDVPIPDETGSDVSTVSFGILKAAQALGDRRALLDAGRRVIRFHLTGDVADGIQTLTREIN
ncbi:MAG: bifunctional transaldolase/phosoglucose isomerase [Deltaproteobacteria bacterium]|nr:bifunctional transaldolase/phosoglucose isomerase [Deltaproteobacteria bacterium]